jgi:glycosyltransferase involved in cell wall biosynthesis
MSARLRVGVPAELLVLPASGGHGKVWHRVLHELRRSVELVALAAPGTAPGTALGLRRRSRIGRRAIPPGSPDLDVVLASGHEPLPVTDAPIVAQIHEAGWFAPALRAVLDPEFLGHIEAHTEAAVRAAAQVIVPSPTVARDVAAAYALDPERVRAVPHGLDRGFTPAATGGAALVSSRAGGPGHAPYVLYAATLHPRKNLESLRLAMAGLAAEGLPHRLAIAGGPAPDRRDSSALERAAAAELPGHPGRVVRLGEPSDAELAGLMAGAAAFCLPSLYEGFGLTALEAMACGAPVVVSDRGALPDVVGEAGVIVAPDPGAIRDGLRRVLTDDALAARLGAAAVTRARAFTWRRTAVGWLAVLHEAARPRAS